MRLRYYEPILDRCEPYLVARASIHSKLERAPMGIEIPEANVFDPQRVDSGPFLSALKTLDEIAYSPLGLKMPSWVFYDCAVMPGAVFGFARRASDLEPWVRKPLSLPDDYDGLVPMSLFIAIPRADRGAWLGYSLCSINEVAPGGAPEGLWRLTLAAGTEALGVDEMICTTRWRSPRLGLYAGLGPLELLTAWTPAHDIRATITFRVRSDRPARERLLRGDAVGPEGIHRYMDADDFNEMRALQDEIERGLRIAVVGPAEIRGAETRVPLQVRGDADDFKTDADAGFRRRFQG